MSADDFRLLGGELPCEVNIGGKIYPFSTDFYDWMRFETLMLDEDVPERGVPASMIKTDIAVRMLFCELPPITPELLRFLLWFWRCGAEKRSMKTEKRSRTAIKKSDSPSYSFEHDEPLIFAAFMQQYGIDLTETKMHWWKFKALFDALSDDTKFVKVMGYRCMDLSDSKMPAERLKHYKRLKEIYKLPRSLSEQQKIDAMKRTMESVKNS